MSVRSWAGRSLAAIASLPLSLRVVLLLVAIVHGVGLSWGLPASDTWDVDGVAPRDFLPGLAETYTPGHFYTYPPLHLALLAILTAPVTVLAIVNAGGTRIPDVLSEIVAVPYMTAMASVARVTALLMSVGITLAVAKIAEEIAPATPPDARRRHAPTFAAGVVGLSIPFTYYAHTSNLDVPYLFWASLAALALVRALARQEPGRLRSAAVFAALAIATKDQAYALFLGSAPVLVVAYAWRNPSERSKVLRAALGSAAIALVLVLLVDGAVTNPAGFRARLAFLGGSASQDLSLIHI